jgi:hypothetical protein
MLDSIDAIEADYSLHLIERNTMYLPNTVHLSLHLRRIDEIFILLDSQVSLVIEHLCVTLVEQRQNKGQNGTHMANAVGIPIRLRSLQLNRISLDDRLMFLSSVHMSALEQLISIEVHGNSKYLSGFDSFLPNSSAGSVDLHHCLKLVRISEDGKAVLLCWPIRAFVLSSPGKLKW